MTVVTRWVAAGSSAAILTGGLFLGAPAAYADTCEASGSGWSQLISAADAVHDTGLHFNSLVADPGTRAELETAQADLERAILTSDVKGPAEGAWNTIRGLQTSYAQTAGSAEVTAAAEAAAVAAADFQAVVQSSGVTMEDGETLVALFEANCGPLLTGAGTDGTTWSGTGTAPGANTGLNVDTAQDEQGASGPLAALLAAGAAAAGAVALWARRRVRA